MKRLVPVLILVLFAVLFAGCTSAYRSQITSLGSDHAVKQFSGGELVGEWISNGKVLSEDGSDGYYFTDKETGRLVRLTGTLQITPELNR